ncbi:helix-hairpin-helix domain-containing protein [Luteibacter sp. PPL201]|jgi:competence protein ComEA|uniref:Helix-hairpin-helix domain-containing protein n=1 Tax=Luteibacter sahnii TaxID=3021977 RepID=A0ABT6BBC7_9GAMM|nr:helix-hairpin-helix domain-containing protein [Luteibacter sp. PPL193]MDY1547408.1 helix-hairpin-helix domain-containing protein [Luteibacter sp. PPL193]
MNRYLSALAALLLATPAFAATPVNVNTADASTLAESLDGVGLAKARAIVAWRDAHGRFESADQLTEVKGIGAALIDRNREAILLDDGKPAKKKAKTASRARAADAEE